MPASETRPRLGIALLAAAGAIVAVGIGSYFGTDLHRAHLSLDRKIGAYGSAAAFVVLGSYSVRRLANQLGRVISRADRSAASVVRLLVTLAGVVVVLLVTLGMLRIDASQLLLGGAITGVVIGIAAQQSLGNMFAGIVLLVAHPFKAGDHVRVKTGSLGGPFEGHVVSMGLTYVVFSTEEGTTLVPNLTLLASGLVRNPRPLPTAPDPGPEAEPEAAPPSASAPAAAPRRGRQHAPDEIPS